MYIQDIALPSGKDRNKKLTGKDYSSRGSIKLSQNDNRQVWSEGDTRQREEMTGDSKEIFFILSHFMAMLLFL